MFSKNRRKVLPPPHPFTDGVGMLNYYLRNDDSEISVNRIDKTFGDITSWLYTGNYQASYGCYSCKAILENDTVRYRCITCQYDAMFDQCEACRRDGLDHDNCHEFMAYYCQQVDDRESTLQTRIKQLIEFGALDVFTDKERFTFNRLDSSETVSRAWSLFLVMLLHSDENDFVLLANQLLSLIPTFLKNNNTKFFSAEVAESFIFVLDKSSSGDLKTRDEDLGNLLMKLCIAVLDRCGDNKENQELDESATRILCSALKFVHHLFVKDGESCFEKDDTQLKLGLKRTILRVLSFKQVIRANVDVEFHLLCIGSHLDILEEPNLLLMTSVRRVLTKLIAQSQHQRCNYLLERINKSSKNQLKHVLNCETLILALLKKMPNTQQEFETRVDETFYAFHLLRILTPSAGSNQKLESKITDLAHCLKNWVCEKSNLSKTNLKVSAKEKDSSRASFLLDDDIDSSPSNSSSASMTTLAKSNQLKEDDGDWLDDWECNEAVSKEKGVLGRKENDVSLINAVSMESEKNSIPLSVMLKNRAKNAQPNKTKSKAINKQLHVIKQQQLTFSNSTVEVNSLVMLPFLEAISVEELKRCERSIASWSSINHSRAVAAFDL